MTHYRLLVVVSLIVVSSFVFPAGTASARECSLDPAELRPLVESVNENVDKVPGFARSQFGGERIDVRVDTTDGVRRYALTTAGDARITRFQAGAPDEPTLRVETSRSTLCDVVEADDPKAAFADAYYGGDVEVSGVGSVNYVKVEAVKIGASISRTFSGLFGVTTPGLVALG